MIELFIIISLIFWALVALVMGICAGMSFFDDGDIEKGMAFFMACLFSILMAVLAGASADQLGLMFT